ncbi:MAG: hypothetical protein ISR58_20060 [Anaerolineales bacterium]|nr:hypothetical protein [Chloroflexota bacterium]MBL6983481.1 hypothetical protein [Anaerolineales bacterium]
MGHTLPPFSQQFKMERSTFSEMRRALLHRDDKALFDDMWNKAEFHVPAAEKAKHPLPIFSILLTMNLEQEKAIYLLEGKQVKQEQQITVLENNLRASESEKVLLRGEIESLRWEVDQLKSSIREELLEIIYPSYAP